MTATLLVLAVLVILVLLLLFMTGALRLPDPAPADLTPSPGLTPGPFSLWLLVGRLLET
jgi:hypothetical protein